MLARLATLVALSLLAAGRAQAADAPDPPLVPSDPAPAPAPALPPAPPAAPSADAPAEGPPPPLAQAPEARAPSDDDWQAYDEAFRALGGGRSDEAVRLLSAVVARNPRHPAARRAAALLARLHPPQAAVPSDVDSDGVGSREDLRTEEPTRGPRAELGLFQTFHGLAVGTELCILAGCNDPASVLLLDLAMAGAGLGISLGATSGGIRAGTVALLDSGVEWGAWNAIALGVSANVSSGSHFAELLLLGQGLGLGGGALLADRLHPTAGQVSLANTGGLWSGLLMLFIRGADDFGGSTRNITLSLLAASDVGLVGGSLLAASHPVTRGHALLIDAGGAAGALLGLGVVALAGGDSTSRHTYFLGMVPGTLAGLGAAAYLARAWDAPSLPVDVAITPAPDGSGLTAVVAGRF
jgi:hypothetical protein